MKPPSWIWNYKMSLKNPDVEILAHEFQIVENLFGYFKIINQWRMTFIPGLWISLVDIMYSEPCAKNSYSFEVWLGRQNASFPKWPIRSNRKRGCAVVRMRWSKHVNRTWKTVKKNEYQICIDWNSRVGLVMALWGASYASMVTKNE